MCVYEKAMLEERRLMNLFKNKKPLYELIKHLRGGKMSDKVSADFYELILNSMGMRSLVGVGGDCIAYELEFKEIIDKCNGLFTYISDIEKKECLDEINRLVKRFQK